MTFGAMHHSINQPTQQKHVGQPMYHLAVPRPATRLANNFESPATDAETHGPGLDFSKWFLITSFHRLQNE